MIIKILDTNIKSVLELIQTISDEKSCMKYLEQIFGMVNQSRNSFI